jgi:phosphoglycolate phosphatase
MTRLLIFDLDGTLLDTSQDIANAINHAIKPVGLKPLSVEKTKSMVGYGISNLIKSLVSAQFHEETLNRFLDHYSKHLIDNTKPYPGVKKTLSELVNYKKAVISNKRESYSREVLEGTGLLEFFDIILGSDSVSERKPSPVPIFEVLKRTDMTKEEAVIIGDSNFDIDAGKAAGIKTIAVTYGYRSKESLKDADFMIDTFGELLNTLARI